MLKNSVKLLSTVLMLSFIIPLLPAEAGNGSYDYRHTKMGSGTRQTGQWEYEITNEKYDFSTNESVFALTRIFNIDNVNNFQFKYEIRGAQNRDMLSPVYRPNNSWWAEIWYWDEFGKLPAGNYTLGVFISLNNGAFKKHDSKVFHVNGENYYDNRFEYDNVAVNGYCQNPTYNFDWMETGKNVKDTGAYSYEMLNRGTNFKSNENVFVMVKNSRIKNTDSFRIKFDVFLNGDSYYKTNEVPTLNPNCNIWAYNYSWANLGNLPAGNHEIRAYIKTNNGSYRLLQTKKIYVEKYEYPVVNYNPVVRPISNTTGINNHRVNYVTARKDYHFGYSWTEADNDIKFHGNYRYSTVNPRNTFSVNEEIKVLTKLSDMRNIKTFRIRHELHKDGNFIKKIETSERQPNERYWEYNYSESNFGKLSAGNYEIRVYISIEGTPWRYLDAKMISVSGNIPFDDFDYDGTFIGNIRDLQNYEYYNVAYPSYVQYPHSRR